MRMRRADVYDFIDMLKEEIDGKTVEISTYMRIAGKLDEQAATRELEMDKLRQENERLLNRLHAKQNRITELSDSPTQKLIDANEALQQGIKELKETVRRLEQERREQYSRNQSMVYRGGA